MIKLYFIGNPEKALKLEKKLKEATFTNLLGEADFLIIEHKSQYVDFFKNLEINVPHAYLVEECNNILPSKCKYILFSWSAAEIYERINKTIKEFNNNKLNEKIVLNKDKIILETANIPVHPSIMMELLTMNRDSDKTFHDIIDKIKMDQGLVAATLRLANSPIYTFTNYIDSIDRAIILLGFDEIKRLISAVSVKSFFEKNFKFYNENGLRLWLHSFNVAKICYDVAKSYNSKSINKDSLYLAGLMHDIGKTVIVDYLSRPVYSYHDEKEQVGYTHMEVGAIILRHWNVAEEIVEAILKHHVISHKLFDKILYFANKRERNDKISKKLKEDIDKYFTQTN
jgi:putative nucleotidyltransferase with HDIG domain